MLCDELNARGANRSIHPAARPAASRSCVLAAPKEVRSLGAKFSVKKSASSDEPKGPFSEADFFTPSHLNMGLNIQEREGTPAGQSSKDQSSLPLRPWREAMQLPQT